MHNNLDALFSYLINAYETIKKTLKQNIFISEQ